MPIATDPNATFKVILESDKDKTPAQVFHFRYPTVHRYQYLAERFENPGGFDDVVSDITNTLDELLSSTEGIDTSDGIAHVLTVDELMEVVAKVMNGGRPTGADLGNSEPPAP